ncbi:MAG: mandelate racemase/muconate lactonizing enzyme family protein, partial [Chloroflexota bacterium]
DLFVGRDPLAVARHVRTLETITFHGGRYWPLEAALWDILGQVTGQPVSVLFGGSASSLPAYASTGEFVSPAERAERATAVREMGFRALKIRIGADRLAEGIEAVAATRRAVGDSMAILVDLNQGWRMPGDIAPALDVAAVRSVAERLRELDVLWLEEPLPSADVAGHRSLRMQTGIRVAGGEMVRTFAELVAALDGDAYDVLQPDVVLAVGMLRARTIAELALARNHWFTPHTWTNGIGVLANLQVAAGVGGGPFIEYPFDPPGWTPDRRDFMLAAPVCVDADGMLRVPDRPGLGAIVDEQAVRRYAA